MAMLTNQMVNHHLIIFLWQLKKPADSVHFGYSFRCSYPPIRLWEFPRRPSKTWKTWKTERCDSDVTHDLLKDSCPHIMLVKLRSWCCDSGSLDFLLDKTNRARVVYYVPSLVINLARNGSDPCFYFHQPIKKGHRGG